MLSLVCVKSFNRLMANVRLREHVQFSVQNQRSLGYPLQLTCIVLCYFYELASLWQVNKTTKTKQNCSFCGHCPLCTRRRFIGALVPEAPLDHYGLGLLTKAQYTPPTPTRRDSTVATYYSHALNMYTRWQFTYFGCFHCFSSLTTLFSARKELLILFKQ